jgi:hypothetical protein
VVLTIDQLSAATLALKFPKLSRLIANTVRAAPELRLCAGTTVPLPSAAVSTWIFVAAPAVTVSTWLAEVTAVGVLLAAVMVGFPATVSR